MDYKQIATQDLIDVFSPPEGGINLYYGRIGQGKTYNATADVLELLSRGRVVYCNWHINYKGFDERTSFIHVFMKVIFGRKLFFKFPPQNLKYFDPDSVDVAFLSSLTDCDVFIDEGQWIFDSYEGSKFSIEKRRLILHTRHLNRSLNIISQRTQAIQVSARGQVNRFYKCEKRMEWPFLIFKRTEFQEMKDNDVDEDSEPASVKTYFARVAILRAFDTHYLRGDTEASQRVHFEAFDYTIRGRLRLLSRFFAFRHALKGVPRRKDELT